MVLVQERSNPDDQGTGPRLVEELPPVVRSFAERLAARGGLEIDSDPANNGKLPGLLPGNPSYCMKRISSAGERTVNPAQTACALGTKKGFRKGAVDAGGEVSGKQVSGLVIGRPDGFWWYNLNGGEWS